MKKHFRPILFCLTSMLFVSCVWSKDSVDDPLIHLVGETHAEPAIIQKELEMWQTHYSQESYRHLFFELAYTQALLLNEWMKSDSDELLDKMFEDIQGTLFDTPEEKEFFKAIKATCPETIFHGTDVGHQFQSTGVWYLEHMKEQGLADSQEYRLCEESNSQGKEYYETNSNDVRENFMVENFIREYDSLAEGTKIMGVYGSAHIPFSKKAYGGKVDCMGKQLNDYYRKRFGRPVIFSDDISSIKTEREPTRIETVEIAGKSYSAAYFGVSKISGVRDYVKREFYRIESDKEDFAKCRRVSDYLPYSNFPTAVHLGDVYMVRYIREDNSFDTFFYRADGKTAGGKLVANRIRVSQ